MPSRKTTITAQARATQMPSIPKELIDQCVTGPMSAEAVQEISSAFKKALIERALGAELSHHLGDPPFGAGKVLPGLVRRREVEVSLLMWTVGCCAHTLFTTQL